MRAIVPVLILFLPASALAQSSAPAAAPAERTAGMPAGARQVRLCAAVDGRLRDFTGWVDAATGDTMLDGRRFRDAHPARYAAGEEWYQAGERLPLPGTSEYTPYGMPRPLSSEDLRQPGLALAHTVRGVQVFATLPRHVPRKQDPDADGLWGCDCEILYVAVDAGCDFQPYQDRRDFGRVRG
jgi:hypothetical protein